MIWKSPWVWLSAVWIVGVVAYANTFSGPFVFDDLTEIAGNQALQDFDVPALWDRYPTRIVTYLTFLIPGYHVMNTLIHLGTATVFFFLVRELAETTQYREKKYLLAGVTALLFVSHPTATQAVTYIVQRLASLTTLLYLLGLLLYVLARKLSNYKSLYVLAFLAILLAMFSKEIAFTAPITILMIEWFFFWRNTPEVSRSLVYLLLLLVIPLTLWLHRPAGIERGEEQLTRPLTAETNSISRRDYAITQINVVRTYLQLLILPVNQNLDYDYPISHSLFEVTTLASGVLLIMVFAFAIWLYPRNRLASFGILFFFLALSVESSFIPIRDVIYEHRLYLPSFGFFLAVVSLLAPHLPKALWVLLIAALSWATIERNHIWQTEIQLWSDVVEKSPAKARGYNNLGVALVKEGQEEQARPHFERAIQLDAGFAEAYNNLGLLEARANNREKAIKLFTQAIEIEPTYSHALNNLGVMMLQEGKPEAALYPLQQAIVHYPEFKDAIVNLAIAFEQVGQPGRAQEQLQEARKYE